MTAVSLALTDAPASGIERAPDESRPGFALYVGVDESMGAAGTTMLADLAQAVLQLVSELGPEMDAHASLSLTARPGTSLIDNLRTELAREGTASAAQRARAAWSRTTVIDLGARSVTVRGAPVALTFKEFALLEYLVHAPHRAVTRDELMRSVWGKGVPASGTRTIDVHVRRLRDKLGGLLQIATVRGVGYRFDPTPEIVLVGSGDAG
ncbi:winged helix-turn-helix domain-containing protein [Actinotalea sp. K2]|uniref:winged helix-turn-helix domain-containing protein n=1 Tax=Actinotalea sp. K2 TaxID=2939438 RepID=UPI002017DFE6|nr:winged helix-turn-helix domain-containing protein [Actinotalea sp. K2]MCL3859720.1 winged helix-turn-helix domain-containing protein [Actinotalea sp. K2]